MVTKIKKRIPKKSPEAEADVSDLEAGGVSSEDFAESAVVTGAAAAATSAAVPTASATAAPTVTPTVVPEDGEEEDATPGKLDFGDVADDEFGRKTARGLQWLVENKGIVIGAAVLALGGALTMWYMQSSDVAERAAKASDFFSATKSFGEAVSPADPEKEVDTKGLLASAQTGFERLKQAGQGTGLVMLANLGLAGTAFQQDKLDEAMKGYDAVLAASDQDPLLKTVALHGQAVAWEDSGKHAEAIKAWKTLGEMNKEAFGLVAGLHVGRLLETSGKSAEAKAHYEALQTEYKADLEEPSNRQSKSELERRLGRLGGGA